MKFFTKLLSSLSLFVLLSTNAFAAIPANLIPDDSEIVFSVNLNQTQDGLSDLFDEIFDNWIDLAQSYGSDNSLSRYLKNLFKNQEFSVAISLNEGQEQVTALVNSDQEDFEDALTEYGYDSLSQISGSDVYEVNGDYLSYKNGQLIASESLEEITKFLNESGKLSQQSEYSTVNSKLNSEGIFHLYLNNISDQLANLVGTNELEGLFTEDIFKLATHEGVSISQNNNGFQVKSYSLINPEFAAKVDLNQTTRLSRYAPAEDLIYYIASKTALDIDSLEEETADIKNADTYLKALEKEISLTIQNTGDLLPAMTFMTDLKGSDSALNNDINSTIEDLWAIVQSEADSSSNDTAYFHTAQADATITHKMIEIGEEDLNQFKIVIDLAKKENPYALEIDSEALTFYLTVGVTDDEIFLFSTSKNIEQDYGQGLSKYNDKDMAMYFEPAELENYLVDLFDELETWSKQGLVDLSQAKSDVAKVLSPWGIIETTGELNSEFSSSITNVNIDVDQAIEIYSSNIWDEFGGDGFKALSNSGEDFYDVSINEWYGDDVYYLSSQGIVSGYYDGTYKPNQEVTRAEFTKLIIKALEKSELIENTYLYNAHLRFNDIDNWDWHNTYISRAFEAGIINGYEDASFRPNNSIARAEATQIIANILNQYGYNTSITDLNFDDVARNAWYYNAISKVTNAGIMNGTSTTTFHPGNNLNRAEAARIIRQLMEYLQQ